MKIYLLCLLVLSVAGCRGFRSTAADASPDQATADLLLTNDRTVDRTPDTTTPLNNDFECKEPWTNSTKTDPGCAPRQVKLIANNLGRTHAVSIARCPQGRVGILYDANWTESSSILRLAYFDQGEVSFKEFKGNEYERVGAASSVAADGSGVIHFAYLTASSYGNEIFYRQLLVDEQVSPAESVATNFSGGGVLALVATGSGDATLAYYNSSTGTIKSRGRSHTTGAWSQPVTARDGLDPTIERGGQLDLILDNSELPRLVYHYAITANLSNPKYTAFDGSSWAMSKTLDNNIPSGTAGWGAQLAINANEQLFASYYAISGDAVQLRLATWRSVDDVPEVSVLRQMTTQGFTFKSFSAGMTIDRHGLLHIVYMDSASSSRVIAYARQFPIGGEIRWLVDLLDDDGFDNSGPALVDIVVDGRDRPHIAYYDRASDAIYYATRSDR
jgi:hypothetical protein